MMQQDVTLLPSARGVFVIGTSTDVGKTFVAGLLIKTLRESGIHATYYKAAASGNPVVEEQVQVADAFSIRQIAALTDPKDTVVSYAYREPLSPHLAARRENNFPSLEVIRDDFQNLQSRSDFVVAEGSGGILCPLLLEKEKEIWLEDVIHALNLPVILVADAGLGTLNATFLTVNYLKDADIPLKGIILNRFDPDNFIHKDNRYILEKRIKQPLLAYVLKNAKQLKNFKIGSIIQ